MLPEFESGLEGIKVSEQKTVEVNFPEDYHGADVAGKTAEFTLKATRVSKPELPEIDEEFAKGFGVQDGDLEKMRADIRANMEKADSPPDTVTLPWSFEATTTPSRTVNSDALSSTRKTNSVPSMDPFRYGVLTSKPRGLRLKDWKAPFSKLSTERSSVTPVMLSSRMAVF